MSINNINAVQNSSLTQKSVEHDYSNMVAQAGLGSLPDAVFQPVIEFRELNNAVTFVEKKFSVDGRAADAAVMQTPEGEFLVFHRARTEQGKHDQRSLFIDNLNEAAKRGIIPAGSKMVAELSYETDPKLYSKPTIQKSIPDWPEVFGK